MTELDPHLTAGFPSDSACLSARIGRVALRLSLEVNRMRALRGDGREERFAGVLMRDSDIAALCSELISDPLPDSDDLTTTLEMATARYDARLSQTPVLPRYARLTPLFGLSVAEEELLALALATAIDPRLARVLGYLNEDLAQQHLTAGLLLRLLPGPLSAAALWDMLGEDGTLVRHGVITLDGPLSGRTAVRLSEAALRLIVSGPGETEIGAQIPGSSTPKDGPILIESTKAVDALIALGDCGPLWLSEGGTVEEVQSMALLAALNGQAHVISGWDAAPPEARCRMMRGLGRLSVVVTQRPALWTGAGVPWVHRVAPPSGNAAREAFWAARAPKLAPLLAEEARATPLRLWHVAREADGDLETAKMLLHHHRSEPMRGLADHIPARFGFDDLELPPAQKARLRGFAARRKQAATVLEDWGLGSRFGAGSGGIALFTGGSGLGKTMAASVVAKAAGLELWRINLATVVSKYIGETEANLDRVFNAADQADVVLFFDEAEALFSKRAEVKEARDRYANMEMAYLLQRIEGFRGMAILASNMGTSLEPAMLRRFDLVMEFQMPDVAARRRLWGRLEAGQVPLGEDVDLNALAETFELAGGHIRQAVLAAAYEAVEDGEITQRHLMRAVAREYVKLGRPLRKEDFGPYFAQVRGVA